MNIRSPGELFHRAERGAVFETFISEMVKNFLHRGERPDLYFWRDSAGHEIDLVIEIGNRPTGVEIKSSHTIASDFFKNLAFWRQINTPTALFYGGDEPQIRSNTVVYPWFWV